MVTQVSPAAVNINLNLRLDNGHCNDRNFWLQSQLPRPRMAMTSDGNEQAAHTFSGISFTLAPLDNGQTIKIVYDWRQLVGSLFPAFKEAFLALGFDEVPWEDLLKVVTVGGELCLKGKKFINRTTYSMRTMQRVFMPRERALVENLMTIVFNDKGNVSYMRELAPFKEVATGFKFDASIALRKTTVVFHAVDQPREDTYRVIIEGEGKGANLCTHLFKFQPSRSWLYRRYPENVC